MRSPSQPSSPGRVLAVLSLAAFMASLDLFIVNVAFEDIGRDLDGVPLADLSWVLNGYAIVYAALLIPLGRLADRSSRKAGFLGGLALFTLASAGCAATSSLWLLVTFRVLQAVGAAALTPASLGLVLSAFPADRRAKAVRIWAATGALAAAFGPVAGGLLVEASWRWVFLVNVPVGVLALVVAWRIVADSRDESVTALPDLLGAGLLAVAVGALSLALVQAPDWGWLDGRTLGAFAGAAIGTAVFWSRSRRHPLPVVEPALLRVRTFAASNLTAIAFSTAFAANLLASVLFLQQVWGYSALETGLGFAPGPLMVPPFAVVATLLRRRIGAGAVTAVGCVLLAAGMAITLSSVGADPSYATTFLPGLLVGGAGVGLALPEIMSAATADLPVHRAATGSAVITMSRQLGAVLGVSVLVAVLGASTAVDAYRDGWWACIVAAVLAALAAPAMTARRTPAPVPARAVAS